MPINNSKVLVLNFLSKTCARSPFIVWWRKCGFILC